MQYDLVFQGGGAKGMAFVGAMAVFEQRNHTFRRLVGTSAGAINAALMAAGYNANDMAEALNETMEDGRPVFESFMTPPSIHEIEGVELNNSLLVNGFKEIGSLIDSKIFNGADVLKWLQDKTLDNASLAIIKVILDRLGYETLKNHAGQAFSLAELGGLFSAAKFVDWLERKLNEKDPTFGGATLGALYKKTNVDLSLCVTDITGNKLLVLNHRTAPDLPLIWAVRMSMSIPFVWPPVTWLSTWGTYSEGTHESVLTDHRIIDGGALSNFALRLTTSAGLTVRAVMAADPDIDEAEFAQFNAQAPTVGFMLDSSLEVPGAGEAPQSVGIMACIEQFGQWLHENAPPTNVVSLFGDVLLTMMTGNDNFVLATQEDSVCRLPVGNIGTLEFDMSPERKSALVSAANNATEAFFKDGLEFVVNELFMGMGDDGKFEIGCNINGNPSSRDWIGLFKSPEDNQADVVNGNWLHVKPGDNLLNTITEAQLGQYEARYYAFHSWGWFGLNSNYKLVKRTGPLNRIVAR
ncbi:MAG: NTE family protein [Alteromonadaceae bacterium]|jgi:NTE family protein